jgi:HEAT repeat protein
MDLSELQAGLQQADYQYRLKALRHLKSYPEAVAIPLFKQHLQDPEFLVRSFVARELGHFLCGEAYGMLLQLIRCDDTPNVRAEAANSLSLFGAAAASQLVSTFVKDDHWLVRRSILGALCDLQCHDKIWEVCQVAIANPEDPATQEAAILALGCLAGSGQEDVALAQLLQLCRSPHWQERKTAALSLKHFSGEQAKNALLQLRQDQDHRVVGAALEELLT